MKKIQKKSRKEGKIKSVENNKEQRKRKKLKDETCDLCSCYTYLIPFLSFKIA